MPSSRSARCATSASEHVEINGQKGYHGVAVFSRLPIAAVEKGAFCRHGHARHMAVTLGEGAGAAAGVTIHNFYVPAGGDIPDPAVNDKFAHKLHFLDTMMEGPARLRAERAVLVGDLNIAPLETDVWNHKALLSVVSHTPVEVERFARVQAAGPWIDAMRAKIDPPRSSTPGGATERKTGGPRTAAGGWTMCGSAPTSPGPSRRSPSTRRRAAGIDPPTTCP